MSAQSNAPVIVKKVRKVSKERHSSGAWKVAYADFVTAMMAFFLLMWLLNATTEKQRKGIADYFNPTIPINRVSGGGDGSFGGDSVFTEETLAHIGVGGRPTPPRVAPETAADSTGAETGTRALQAVEELLTGRSGESMVSDQVLRHIVTRVTDEGLVVEIFDIAGDPLFDGDTDVPQPLLTEIADVIAGVFDLVTNPVAIGGFVRSEPVVLSGTSMWDLSAARADRVREMLESAGLEPARVARVTGHADRRAATSNPMAVRNNRIELILLRSDL